MTPTVRRYHSTLNSRTRRFEGDSSDSVVRSPVVSSVCLSVCLGPYASILNSESLPLFFVTRYLHVPCSIVGSSIPAFRIQLGTYISLGFSNTMLSLLGTCPSSGSLSLSHQLINCTPMITHHRGPSHIGRRLVSAPGCGCMWRNPACPQACEILSNTVSHTKLGVARHSLKV